MVKKVYLIEKENDKVLMDMMTALYALADVVDLSPSWIGEDVWEVEVLCMFDKVFDIENLLAAIV